VKLNKWIPFVIALAVLALPVAADQSVVGGTPVVQASTRNDACTALNATNAVNTQTTLTIPSCSGGQSIYISEIDVNVSNDGTGAVVSTNASFTSTNLNQWKWVFSSTNVANTMTDKSFQYPTAMKAAAAGTAVTIVSPSANTHAEYTIQACYWCAQ
jgi:hypothetical protein